MFERLIKALGLCWKRVISVSHKEHAKLSNLFSQERRARTQTGLASSTLGRDGLGLCLSSLM